MHDYDPASAGGRAGEIRGTQLVAERLTKRLRARLPGVSAQRRMAPIGRLPDDYVSDPPGARPSAVLLLVTSASDLVFIRRTQDGRPHGGQIAFPGGASEERDSDLVATALRETEEEIGVKRDAVTVLGLLTPLYIPVTNFTVQPVVGYAQESPSFVPHPHEVEEVIVLPIAGFEGRKAHMTVSRQAGTYEAPCYRFENVEVWGATAMITAEFLEVWADAGRSAP